MLLIADGTSETECRRKVTPESLIETWDPKMWHARMALGRRNRRLKESETAGVTRLGCQPAVDWRCPRSCLGFSGDCRLS